MNPEACDPLMVNCPTCGAAGLAPCITLNLDNRPRSSYHLARRRAAGEVIQGRIGSASPSQVAARERNWGLFQIRGAVGNLRQVNGLRFQNEQRQQLRTAIDALQSILDEVKRSG